MLIKAKSAAHHYCQEEDIVIDAGIDDAEDGIGRNWQNNFFDVLQLTDFDPYRMHLQALSKRFRNHIVNIGVNAPIC